MLKQKAVLVNLCAEETKQLLRGHNIVGDWRADAININVVLVPLVPQLADLIHHGERHSVLFPDPIRPPLIVLEARGYTLLAVLVGLLTCPLVKGRAATLLLQRADVARV